MTSIIPEPNMDVAELRISAGEGSVLRLPASLDVPLSARVRRMIDTPVMRRLASIRQLGLVSLVYPGATHSRWEHSLGVYYNATRLLMRFQDGSISPRDAEAFLVAALVHDAGHWPFCHPIEDIRCDRLRLPVKHEARVEALLRCGVLADCLAEDWRCTVDDVMSVLCPERSDNPSLKFLASCLSGPIDIDKLDYLRRDSLHAGVPYGLNFDESRLFASMRRHPERPQLAIGAKGRTAAEMMVFSRYVMFSEVYWHGTVRAATAMLQRVVYEQSLDLVAMAEMDDQSWIAALMESTRSLGRTSLVELAEGLFGPVRRVHKAVAQFDATSGSDVHQRLARRPYAELVRCARHLADRISREIGITVPPDAVLIDAPPVKLEVDINMAVIDFAGNVLTLGDVSPVVSVLANRQFDNHVKRVRVFVPEKIREAIRRRFDERAVWTGWLSNAISLTESEFSEQ